MKKQIIKAFFTLIATSQRSLLVLFCTILTFVVTAQREPKSVRDDNRVIKAMTKRVDKIGWLYYKEKTKLTYQSLINENKDAFGLTANDVVKVDKEENDAIGGRHQRLKQYYKGIEVENISYVLHFDKKGHLTHSNGELGEEIDGNTNVEPKVSEAEALEKAVSALDGLKPAWTNPMLEQNLRRIREDSSATYKPKGKLLLVLTDNGKYQLAYIFGIITSDPMGDWQVCVDARSKQICGVQNRWFNLLSQGGTQNGVTVQGIGIDNAAKIAYYNLTTQLFSSATFQNAANGAVAIAESFYGCASNELEQTRRAWQAVGVNTPQPQLSINGGGDVCSEYYDTQVTLEGCWRFGTNYWWTVPSQFVSWTSGTGNNTLTITVPAHYQGAINLSVYAAVNGSAPQTVPITINAFDCGGPAIIGGGNTNQSLKKQFILSPNPTTGIVNLSLPSEFTNAILEAEIYNALGQKVYGRRVGGNDNQLEISELPKGIYNVVLKNLSNKEIIFSSKLTKI